MYWPHVVQFPHFDAKCAFGVAPLDCPGVNTEPAHRLAQASQSALDSTALAQSPDVAFVEGIAASGQLAARCAQLHGLELAGRPR